MSRPDHRLGEKEAKFSFHRRCCRQEQPSSLPGQGLILLCCKSAPAASKAARWLWIYSGVTGSRLLVRRMCAFDIVT